MYGEASTSSNQLYTSSTFSTFKRGAEGFKNSTNGTWRPIGFSPMVHDIRPILAMQLWYLPSIHTETNHVFMVDTSNLQKKAQIPYGMMTNTRNQPFSISITTLSCNLTILQTCQDKNYNNHIVKLVS